MNLQLLELTPKKQAVFFVGLALLQFLVQASVLARGVEYIATTLTNDDAYYYLQTAWNIKQLGFPTFDGLHATNGVQFLWFWIVTLAAWLAPTKAALLHVSLMITFLFNAACYLIIWQLGQALQRPVLALYLACFWFFLSFGSGIYSIGMENSLHALIFWAVVWQATTFLMRAQHHQRPQLLQLTILLIFNVWTRLDGAIFSIILYGSCLFYAFYTEIFNVSRRRDLVGVVISGGITLLGLAIQMIIFQWMGGSILPVSTLVKQSWSNWDNVWSSVALPIIGIMIVLGLIAVRLFKLYDPEQKLAAFKVVWYSLLVGVIFHLISTAGVDAYRWYLWYLSPAYIFWIITISLIIDGFVRLITSRLISKTSLLLPITVCLLIFTAAGFLFVLRLATPVPLYVTRYQAAQWMAENLPANSVCASWNAGQIGFFSERRVINLDGLINDIDYYRRVLLGPFTWVDYIYENGVDCIADHNRSRISASGFSVVQSFPVNDGSGLEFLIWQVPPAQMNINQGKAGE